MVKYGFLSNILAMWMEVLLAVVMVVLVAVDVVVAEAVVDVVVAVHVGVVVAAVGAVNVLVRNDTIHHPVPNHVKSTVLRFTVLNQIIIECRKMNSFSHLLCELSSLDP